MQVKQRWIQVFFPLKLLQTPNGRTTMVCTKLVLLTALLTASVSATNYDMGNVWWHTCR